MSIKAIALLLLLISASCIGSCAGSTSKAPSSVLSPKATTGENAVEKPELLARLSLLLSANPKQALEIGAAELGLSPDKTPSLLLCDRGLSWRVISLDTHEEVSVSKGKDQVAFPRISIRRNVFEANPGAGSVSRREAVEIAKHHFIEYGRNKFNSDESIMVGYFPSICDLGSQWRVYFLSEELEGITQISDIVNLSNNHPPDYIIDKNNGQIIYFNFAASN